MCQGRNKQIKKCVSRCDTHTPILSLFLSRSQTHANTFTLSLSLSLSRSLSLSLSLLLTDTHTHTHTHTHTFTLSLSFSLSLSLSLSNAPTHTEVLGRASWSSTCSCVVYEIVGCQRIIDSGEEGVGRQNSELLMVADDSY